MTASLAPEGCDDAAAGAGAGAGDRARSKLLIAIAAAVLLSGGLIAAATGSILTGVAFLAGIAVLAPCVLLAGRLAGRSLPDQLAPPDWSVTVAAIAQPDLSPVLSPDLSIAITDRANRLTCANDTYRDWFGDSSGPNALPLDHASREVISCLAREAWRDGRSNGGHIARADDGARFAVTAERAGRGDDYLVWRFIREQDVDHVSAVSEWITGPFGALLSAAGIEAACVDPRGYMRAVSPGFAARASGDADATLAGQEFVRQLRTDDAEHVYFAREGREGPSRSLIQVPLEPDVETGDGSSLMLLLESGIAIGGMKDTAKSAATPQLEALLGALPLGLAMADRDGRFLFANPAFLRAIDAGHGEVPQYPSDMVVKEDKGALADAVRRFGKGTTSNGDMAVRLRHQPDEPVSLSLAGVRGLGEAAVLLSLSDSTEETRLKRQLAQKTKMQAVGKLAGGVAHDFNNVLTAIIGYCDLMLLRHTPGDSDYDDIQQIRANSNRAASLTRQLLAFSRQQTLRPEILQLPDVISEVSQLLKRLLGAKIVFTVRHDRDLGPVRADPQQLEQVIVNLAVNARDAIQARGDGSGHLSMTTRRVSAGDVRRMESDIIPVGDYTVLTVEDDGGGIPTGTLGKIFEPFFTTKEMGKGTGLGLSTVYGIVKQSGGFIFAENVGQDGGERGARFTIYLPIYVGEIANAKSGPKQEEAKPTSNWSGGGRILLVEDEDGPHRRRTGARTIRLYRHDRRRWGGRAGCHRE